MNVLRETSGATIQKLTEEKNEIEALLRKTTGQMKEEFEKKQKDLEFRLELMGEDYEKLNRKKNAISLELKELQDEYEKAKKLLEKANIDLENLKLNHADEMKAILHKKSKEIVFFIKYYFYRVILILNIRKNVKV